MKRILVISDDFNELTFLETLLKKIGFDTLGIQNANQALEQTMLMNPDMLILSETIKGQSTHALLENLMGFRPQMLVILLKKDLKSKTEHVAEFVNRSVKTPVDPLDLIKSVCQIAQLKEDQFIEKYSKLGLFKGDPTADAFRVSGKVDEGKDKQFVSGSGSTATGSVKVSEKRDIGGDNQFVKGVQLAQQDARRSKRFENALKEMSEPKSGAFSHKEAAREAAEFRNRSQDAEIVKIDDQRKNFVRALFKKKA